MKNTYLINSKHFTLIALSMALLPILGQAATVSSVSREQYRQDSPEDIYWEVSVNCSGIREARIIEQKADTNEWCAKDVDGFCKNDKMAAAKEVCGAGYRRQLAAQERARAPEPEPEAKPAEVAPRVTITPPSAVTPAPEASKPAPVVSAPVPAAPGAESVSSNADSATSDAAANDAEFERLRLLSSEIEIETQRISIEQEKLDLRRRELELKKRELDLLQASGN